MRYSPIWCDEALSRLRRRLLREITTWNEKLHYTRVSLSSFVDSITLNEKHLKWTYLRMTQTFSCNKSMKMTTTFKETKPYPKMFARPTFWAGTRSSLQFYWWLSTLKRFVCFICCYIFFSLYIYLSQDAGRGSSKLQQGMGSDLSGSKIVFKNPNKLRVSFHLFSLWTRPLYPGIKKAPLVKLEIQRASSLVLKHSKIWKSLLKLKFSPLMNKWISLILETCFQKTVSLSNTTGAAVGLIKIKRKKILKKE